MALKPKVTNAYGVDVINLKENNPEYDTDKTKEKTRIRDVKEVKIKDNDSEKYAWCKPFTYTCTEDETDAYLIEVSRTPAESHAPESTYENALEMIYGGDTIYYNDKLAVNIYLKPGFSITSKFLGSKEFSNSTSNNSLIYSSTIVVTGDLNIDMTITRVLFTIVDTTHENSISSIDITGAEQYNSSITAANGQTKYQSWIEYNKEFSFSINYNTGYFDASNLDSTQKFQSNQPFKLDIETFNTVDVTIKLSTGSKDSISLTLTEYSLDASNNETYVKATEVTLSKGEKTVIPVLYGNTMKINASTSIGNWFQSVTAKYEGTNIPWADLSTTNEYSYFKNDKKEPLKQAVNITISIDEVSYVVKYIANNSGTEEEEISKIVKYSDSFKLSEYPLTKSNEDLQSKATVTENYVDVNSLETASASVTSSLVAGYISYKFDGYKYNGKTYAYNATVSKLIAQADAVVYLDSSSFTSTTTYNTYTKAIKEISGYQIYGIYKGEIKDSNAVSGNTISFGLEPGGNYTINFTYKKMDKTFSIYSYVSLSTGVAVNTYPFSITVGSNQGTGKSEYTYSNLYAGQPVVINNVDSPDFEKFYYELYKGNKLVKTFTADSSSYTTTTTDSDNYSIKIVPNRYSFKISAEEISLVVTVTSGIAKSSSGKALTTIYSIKSSSQNTVVTKPITGNKGDTISISYSSSYDNSAIERIKNVTSNIIIDRNTPTTTAGFMEYYNMYNNNDLLIRGFYKVNINYNIFTTHPSGIQVRFMDSSSNSYDIPNSYQYAGTRIEDRYVNKYTTIDWLTTFYHGHGYYDDSKIYNPTTKDWSPAIKRFGKLEIYATESYLKPSDIPGDIKCTIPGITCNVSGSVVQYKNLSGGEFFLPGSSIFYARFYKYIDITISASNGSVAYSLRKYNGSQHDYWDYVTGKVTSGSSTVLTLKAGIDELQLVPTPNDGYTYNPTDTSYLTYSDSVRKDFNAIKIQNFKTFGQSATTVSDNAEYNILSSGFKTDTCYNSPIYVKWIRIPRGTNTYMFFAYDETDMQYGASCCGFVVGTNAENLEYSKSDYSLMEYDYNGYLNYSCDTSYLIVTASPYEDKYVGAYMYTSNMDSSYGDSYSTSFTCCRILTINANVTHFGPSYYRNSFSYSSNKISWWRVAKVFNQFSNYSSSNGVSSSNNLYIDTKNSGTFSIKYDDNFSGIKVPYGIFMNYYTVNTRYTVSYSNAYGTVTSDRTISATYSPQETGGGGGDSGGSSGS